MLYTFGPVAYHPTEPRILADQLRLAKFGRRECGRADANSAC